MTSVATNNEQRTTNNEQLPKYRASPDFWFDWILIWVWSGVRQLIKVTTKHKKWSKSGLISIKGPFLPEGPKNLGYLQVGLRFGQYLLVLINSLIFKHISLAIRTWWTIHPLSHLLGDWCILIGLGSRSATVSWSNGGKLGGQCSAVKCIAVQCNAVQCSAVQCSAVQCSAVQCSAVQGCTIQKVLRKSMPIFWSWCLSHYYFKLFQLGIFRIPWQSQGLLYKELSYSIINSISNPFPPTALRRCHAKTVRDSSSSYKIDYVIVIKNFFKSWRALNFHQWFWSYGHFTERVDLD